MRILYIITQADGGGAQKYALTLAKHFGGAIACGNEAQDLFEKAGKMRIPTFALKNLKRNVSPWHDFLAIWEIRELVKKYKPDIVHLNSTKAGIFGSFSCMNLFTKKQPSPGGKTKVVFTAHGFIFNEPMSWLKKSLYITLEKEASRFRDKIIAVSEADLGSAMQYNIISREKISVIHNGIVPINFLDKDEAKKQLGIINGKTIIGTIANFYPTKGLDVLIDAVKLLPEELLNKCQFVIFGDGPERGNLKAKISNSKLENNFLLLGAINNAASYLKALDVFVLPSRKEGLPYTILEAMQAGLPIIASSVGGIPEALSEAGILTQAEDPSSLAQAIENAVNNESLRHTLSQKALSRSLLFTEEKMLQETEKIYNQITS